MSDDLAAIDGPFCGEHYSPSKKSLRRKDKRFDVDSKQSTPAHTLKTGGSESLTVRNKNYKFNEIQKDKIAEESQAKEEVMTQVTKKAPKPAKNQDDKKAPPKIVE